ncbi:uncharacterized protein [Physcomitrium patens]|uniref:uncharacterized protein isoform X1 n=1 Tax=Physcomitrium patens TaxID=3218 RepID=UPI003CCDA83A
MVRELVMRESSICQRRAADLPCSTSSDDLSLEMTGIIVVAASENSQLVGTIGVMWGNHVMEIRNERCEVEGWSCHTWHFSPLPCRASFMNSIIICGNVEARYGTMQ